MKKQFWIGLIIGAAIFSSGYVSFFIQRADTKYYKRQTEQLLWLLTPATEFVRPRISILEDSFKIDRATAIQILTEVYKASDFFELDPTLVLGLIEQESRFINTAISSAGAQGLTQVMPHWFREYSPYANPFDIKTSIRMGTFILWVYINISKDQEEALARYYAGNHWDSYLVYSKAVLEKQSKW